MSDRIEHQDRRRCIQWGLLTLAAMLALLAPAGRARGDEPAASQPAAGRTLKIARQAPPADPFISDAEIGQAIEKAQAWLMDQFANGKIRDYDEKEAKLCSGADALAVYALLQCGLETHKKELDPKHPYMKALLDVLKSLPVTQSETYTRGLRITALATANRKEDQGVMGLDVNALLDACGRGAYTYSLPDNFKDSRLKRDFMKEYKVWDNSNSQYGLLGVWSAAEVGAEIPDEYWAAVQKHWSDCQLDDGQWDYGPSNGSIKASITWVTAGLASLFVCHEYLDVPKAAGQVGREPFTPALAKGLAWMEAGDNAIGAGTHYYACYGVERVGLASGFKYFGQHDWYRHYATEMVKAQNPDGSFDSKAWFASPLIDTGYCLLFLARGRHPLLMNKLRFEHFWDNRPRDAANLCKYAGKELEGEFNWQVITLQHDWPDWTDCPLLYIASHEAPKMKDEDFAEIRSFVEAGGLLLTHADGGGKGFNDWVEKELVKKAFPVYELEKVPDKHDLYGLTGAFKGNKPPLKMVTNGSRVLMVHSPGDLATAWQQKATRSRPEAFEVGLNLFIYAAGKKDFRNRLVSNYIPAPPEAPADNVVKVARVKYALPTWDPEPYAWVNFARWMGWETSVGVKTLPTDMAALGGLSPADVPLAHLTGTNPYTPTDAEIESLKKYVDAGGVLFVDACGGTTFNDSIAKMLAKAFPDAKLAPLPSTSPLLAATGEGAADLGKLRLRPYAQTALGGAVPSIRFLKSGKGQVIYSSLDVTTGLLSGKTWCILGYDNPVAQQMMRNLVLWAGGGTR